MNAVLLVIRSVIVLDRNRERNRRFSRNATKNPTTARGGRVFIGTRRKPISMKSWFCVIVFNRYVENVWRNIKFRLMRRTDKHADILNINRLLWTPISYPSHNFLCTTYVSNYFLNIKYWLNPLKLIWTLESCFSDKSTKNPHKVQNINWVTVLFQAIQCNQR